MLRTLVGAFEDEPADLFVLELSDEEGYLEWARTYVTTKTTIRSFTGEETGSADSRLAQVASAAMDLPVAPSRFMHAAR